jgi:polysaccharide export outer membrane protein
MLLTFLLLILIGGAAPAAAQESREQANAPARSEAAPDLPAQQGASEYILGPSDVIEVDVLGQSDFKSRVRVKANGTLALPFLGDVQVEGETPTSLAQKVAAALAAGGYFRSPVVSVEVVGYASRYVTVLGAVASPGLHPIDRDYRMSEILARAGGLRESAAEYVTLIRASGEEMKLDYRKIATGAGTDDPRIAAGDKIFVPLAEFFYIYGQVNAPGGYPLKDDMTVRKAIARSGGLTVSGSDKRVSVFRDGQKVKLGLNEAVRAGDVVVVGERLF